MVLFFVDTSEDARASRGLQRLTIVAENTSEAAEYSL